MSEALIPGRHSSLDPDLTDRQRRALLAFVEIHEATARPVGSESVALHPAVTMSSASVRQDLVELERLGLLERPRHTGSRLPTPHGFELYVRTLMNPQPLDPALAAIIDEQIGRSRRTVEEMLEEASRLLASLTRQLGLALASSLEHARLANLDLGPLSERRALLVLTLEGGAVRSLVLELESPLPGDALHEVAEVLRERLVGYTLADVRLALEADPTLSGISAVRIVTSAAARGWSAPISTPLFSAGAGNMAGQPEFSDSQHLAPVLHAVETGVPIGGLMVAGAEGYAEVHVGLDGDGALANLSLIAYTLPGPVRAAVGVLGPLRMNYSLAYAVVDRMGSRLTQVLNG